MSSLPLQEFDLSTVDLQNIQSFSLHFDRLVLTTEDRVILSVTDKVESSTRPAKELAPNLSDSFASFARQLDYVDVHIASEGLRRIFASISGELSSLGYELETMSSDYEALDDRGLPVELNTLQRHPQAFSFHRTENVRVSQPAVTPALKRELAFA